MTLSIEIITALIASFTSVGIALWTYWSSRKNERDIAVLQAELGEQQAERDARRDYEYEARKRLYQVYEPLLFQLIELSENAIYRVASLARSARLGDIRIDGSGWLSGDGYYLISTLYNLLCPIAVLKLMQHRLTLVDLSLEPQIKSQYTLLKRLFITYTDDFDLARIQPILEYKPFENNWKTLRLENPRKHWRQGLPVYRLEAALEALITKKSDKAERIMTFGEFEAAYNTPGSAVRTEFALVADIFIGFHPKNRPILWRILITQVHIHKALIQASQKKITQDDARRLMNIISEDDRNDFDWRHPGDNDPEFAEPFIVAKNYFEDRVQSLVKLQRSINPK